MSNLRTGIYGQYYGSYFNESTPLTQSQMETNATYIYSFLTAHGWTINGIAALLGNMTAESTINPGRWQSDSVNWTDGGYGLVQWTPSTKYIDWCSETGYSDPSEMDNNLSRILYEVGNGIQWIATSAYNLSFYEFSRSTDPPSELAKAFLLNYERPADQSESVQEYRAALADTWYSYITGTEPTPPTPVTPSTTKKRKFNFLLFGKKPWRNRQWLT